MVVVISDQYESEWAPGELRVAPSEHDLGDRFRFFWRPNSTGRSGNQEVGHHADRRSRGGLDWSVWRGCCSSNRLLTLGCVLSVVRTETLISVLAPIKSIRNGETMDPQAAQPMSASTTTKTGKRSARRRRQPYGWLGAGALTLGVGAALAGAGVAHADDAASAGSARPAEASQAAVNSQKAPQAAVRNRGAAVRTVGEGAAPDRTANTRVVAAGTSGRSAALATVSRRAAATTVGSPSKAVVAPTTVAPTTAAPTGVAPVSQPPFFGGFRFPPSPTQGAPRFEGTFGPGAPKPADFGVFAPLAWAAAEVAYHVQGLSPLARPFQFQSVPGDEEVHGTLNTVAAYGAPVKFEVTNAPANGRVAIDSQGHYTYTPDAAFADSGGTDVFTVTATDMGPHLGKLLGVPGRATTMTVPVTVAAPAEAEPASADSRAKAASASANSSSAPTSGTWTIVNTSWATQTFGNVVSQAGTIRRHPAVNSQIQTGESADYTLQSNSSTLGGGSNMKQQLSSGNASSIPGTLSWNPSAPLRVGLDVGAVDKTYYTDYVYYWDATCKPKSGSCYEAGGAAIPDYGTVNSKGPTTIYVNDAPGTVVTVAASDAQRQSDIMQRLVKSDLSNATFHPKGQPTIGYTNPLPVEGFQPIPNGTRDNIVDTSTHTQTTTKTDSTQYGVTVGLSYTYGTEAPGVKQSVTASTSASNTWGTSTADAETYTQTVAMTVEPGDTLYLFSETPVQRFYGDWTVQYGNTTYHLTDVWYNTPYPAAGRYSVYLTPYTCTTGSDACAAYAQGNLPAGVSTKAPANLPKYPVAESSAS